jgi:NAD(P)-dependent dehydrogenase (short-subunit alcohol dehydrogenase family)
MAGRWSVAHGNIFVIVHQPREAQMDMELQEKLAIVTGGSRGIGKAIATELAKEGAKVAIVARDLAAAEAAASEIAAKTGQSLYAYRADTGKDDDVRAAISQIMAEHERIDILVNCAAQPAGQKPAPKLDGITDDIFWADVNVKVLGYLRCAREVAPVMQRQRSGRIINISGLAARQTGSIVGSIRNVSVAALTKNLADELGPHGINVTCVHPGITRTEKTPDALRCRASAAGLPVEAIEQRLAEDTAIRHMVTAKEVAYVVTFLASPKSIAVSGDAIAVGGGKVGAIYY